MSSLIKVFGDKGSSVFVDVGAVLIETSLKFVFGLAHILAMVAFVTKEHVYDVFCFACEFVSYLKCLQSLHAFECGGLNEMIGTNSASFSACKASIVVVFDGREDRWHEEGFDVPSVSFSYHG